MLQYNFFVQFEVKETGKNHQQNWLCKAALKLEVEDQSDFSSSTVHNDRGGAAVARSIPASYVMGIERHR